LRTPSRIGAFGFDVELIRFDVRTVLRYGLRMAITKGYKQLLAEANAKIVTRSVAEAQELLSPEHADHDRMVFVDIRDPRELEREGMLPGAFSAPRGMLEFWVDPESPYFKPIFADESKHFVLYCGGGWRSALTAATLQDMGMTNVSHIDGGFAAWKEAGAPVVEKPSKPAK
jgi:rhodanese-related sulfurtransferase